MSTYPPRARDVDQTINSIVAEAAPVAAIRPPLRLIRSGGSIDNDRPVALGVSPEPTMPVTLHLGDFAQLLHLAGPTPMTWELGEARATVEMTPTMYRAAALLLEHQGTEWAENVQDAIAGQIHPSFLPPVGAS